MSDTTDAMSIVYLLGCLLLVGSAFASYRMDWGKSAQLALTWLAIFVGAFLLASALGLEM